MATTQQQAIEARGFRDVLQFNGSHEPHLKSFWRAVSSSGVAVCVKCFHGFSAAANAWWGKKEARMAEYWRTTLTSPLVRSPRVEDEWQGAAGEYFVALEWIDGVQMSLQRWAASRAEIERLRGFLEQLASVSPPDWWTEELAWPPDHRPRVPAGLLDSSSGERSPWGEDLVDNLHRTANGEVVFLDYVHVTWQPRWFLGVYTAAELLRSTLRYVARPGYSPVRTLLRQTPRTAILEAMPRVAIAQAFRHRHRPVSRATRIREAGGRRLIAAAARMGIVGR